jgi:hypothetical protein
MDATPEEVTALRRQLTWDMLCHFQLDDPDIRARFGMTPTSDEVVRKEHEESDRRLKSTLPLYERITVLASLAAGITHRGILEPPDDALIGDDDLKHLGIVLTICSNAIVADLIDKGLLTPGTPEDQRYA